MANAREEDAKFLDQHTTFTSNVRRESMHNFIELAGR